MWDEFVIGGDVQETSKKNVLKAISDQDMIQEVSSISSLTSYTRFDFLQHKKEAFRFLLSFLTIIYILELTC